MRLRVGNATVTGVFDDFGVLVQRTLRHLERRSLPRRPPLVELLRADVQLNRVLHSVDRDDIAVPDQGNRPANLGLGNNVADAEAV